MPPRKKKPDDSSPSPPLIPLHRRIAGMAVHLLTAAGAAAGLMALVAAFEQEFSAMFVWLGLALLIDGVDGTFARLAKVKQTAPDYDGAVLDLVIDYLTYVVVPVVAIWRSGLIAEDVALPLGLLVMVCSSLYFADRRMKMEDHFFRGFPALWNVVALYLFVFRMPGWVNVTIILLLCGLMFLRVPFAHPIRVRALRPLTLVITCVWFASALVAVTHGLRTDVLAKLGLGLGGLYFIGLSVWRMRSK